MESPLEVKREYRVCMRCVMDTTAPEIKFDNDGVCNFCLSYEAHNQKILSQRGNGERILNGIIKRIKKNTYQSRYNCLIGVSGGVDSSYLAYLSAKKFGLRPLALHVDCGWNSEIAVKNIQSLMTLLDIDLHTEVINWDEMKDLQTAFLKSGVANQDVPQDHAIFAALYKFAIKNKFKYILTGSNYYSEYILPASWGYEAMDSRHLKSIHRIFGTRPLLSYPTVNILELRFMLRYLHGIRVVFPLEYLHYRKFLAIQELERELGWRYYGGKHFESRFTKYFQAYYLPYKFGFDKRRAHLSSVIMSGQITRQDALRELEQDLYPNDQLQEDKQFVINKLGFTSEQFAALLHAPNKSHLIYPCNANYLPFLIGRIFYRGIKKILGVFAR